MSEFLSASQLVESTKEEYRNAFGNVDIPVAVPTELVLETQRMAEGEGYGFLKPLYFPFAETRLDAPTPDDWEKLEPGFFDYMSGRNPSVNPEAAKIGPYWTLFDESKRPEFAGDEKFGLILARGRDEGLIDPEHICDVEKTFRGGVSMDEQDRYVFSELVKPLRLVDHIAQALVVIRRPKAAEFNFAGNLRYKHLGGHPAWEGFEDKYRVDRRLIGGGSVYRGLSRVGCIPSDVNDGHFHFRPLVVFLFQHQNLITW